VYGAEDARDAQHSYLDLREVVEENVRHPGTRMGILLLRRFAHLLMAAPAMFAVFEAEYGVLA